MNTKKKYIAPEMSEFYYRVEIGFVNSQVLRMDDYNATGFDQYNQQTWEDDGSYFGGGSTGWDW